MIYILLLSHYECKVAFLASCMFIEITDDTCGVKQNINIIILLRAHIDRDNGVCAAGLSRIVLSSPIFSFKLTLALVARTKLNTSYVRIRTYHHMNSFRYSVIKHWNQLPDHIISAASHSSFKRSLNHRFIRLRNLITLRYVV